MEKRLFLLGVVLVVCLCGSAALALDPLGPPVAGLNQGQFRAGIEYFYETSEIQTSDSKMEYFYNGRLVGSEDFPNVTLKVKEHMVTGNIGYGITDNWEFFGRLGCEVDGEATMHPFGYGPEEMRFEGDESFVFGFGTKVTFYEEGKAKLGAMFQISWGESDGEIKITDEPDYSADVDTLEWSVAVGPSYQLTETVSIYGGPFLYFLDGDVEAEYSWTSGPNSYKEEITCDIEESSSAGGYIGAQADLAEDCSFNVEWLHTHDADALAMMLAWEF